MNHDVPPNDIRRSLVRLHHRNRHESDQGASIPRLLVLAPALAAVALGAGRALAEFYFRDSYWIMFLAAVSAVLVSLLMRPAIRLAHCRNAAIATALGFSTGMAGYLSYYHFGMLRHAPKVPAWRVDALPFYIAARMESDVVVDTHAPRVPGMKRSPSPGMNWFGFVMELGFMTLIPAFAARGWSAGAYDADSRRWHTWNAVRFPSFSSSAILETIVSGGILRARFTPTHHLLAGLGMCRLIVETAPRDENVREWPVYLSLEDSRGTGFLQYIAKRVVWQVELRPEEVATVLALFPVEAHRWASAAVQ